MYLGFFDSDIAEASLPKAESVDDIFQGRN